MFTPTLGSVSEDHAAAFTTRRKTLPRERAEDVCCGHDSSKSLLEMWHRSFDHTSARHKSMEREAGLNAVDHLNCASPRFEAEI